MSIASSDQAQTIWQNMVLISYASTIAAIPLGDSLLFSFTNKKPLAIGVARSVFVSSLGASFGMLTIFGVWITLEKLNPTLHMDHYFYQMIDQRLQTKDFYRLSLIFLSIESCLTLLAALLGGALASITPFVGEQNQSKTKFSFSSLFLDVPLGISSISSIQVLLWCTLKYIHQFSTHQDSKTRRSAFSSHRRNVMTSRNNRRVTFKTELDESMAGDLSSSNGDSDGGGDDTSHTSSTLPSCQNAKEDKDSTLISKEKSLSQTSSSSTLNNDDQHPTTRIKGTSESFNTKKVEEDLTKRRVIQPLRIITHPQPIHLVHSKETPPPVVRGTTSTIPPITITKPTPPTAESLYSKPRLTPSSPLSGKYHWLRHQHKDSSTHSHTTTTPQPLYSSTPWNSPSPSSNNPTSRYIREKPHPSSSSYNNHNTHVTRERPSILRDVPLREIDSFSNHSTEFQSAEDNEVGRGASIEKTRNLTTDSNSTSLTHHGNESTTTSTGNWLNPFPYLTERFFKSTELFTLNKRKNHQQQQYTHNDDHYLETGLQENTRVPHNIIIQS